MSFLGSLIDFEAGQLGDLAQTVTTLALGGNLDLLRVPAVQPQFADVRSRTISLQLFDVSPANGGGGNRGIHPQQSAYAKSALQQVAPILPATSVPANPIKTGAIAAVTFDVTQNPDGGWAQRLEYGAISRQSEQNTALGFHVNEWGVGIAPLSVDAIVSLGGNPPGAVQKFFDLLYLAKRTRPLSDEYPKILRYTDVYLGRSFIITQRTVRLTESAEEPHIARLRIEAGIIRDYANSWGYVNNAPGANALSGGPSATNADQAGLLAFD